MCVCLYIIYVQDYRVLEDKLDQLRKAVADAGEAGEADEILQELQRNTTQLLQDTADIMKTIEGELL